MTQLIAVVSSVLTILVLERVVVTRLTRNAAGREWVRRTWFLHPNTISLVRIPMGVVSVILAVQGHWVASILWFCFWMITDLTDGTVARNCDLTSESGKWLDPLSDKCMYFPVLIFFAVSTKIATPLPGFWVGLLVAIDTLGQASRLVTRKTAANYFGKAKTGLITSLLALVALNHIQPIWLITPKLVGMLTVSCTILAFMSVYCKVIPDRWYANSLTLANFFCGLASIWSVHQGFLLKGFMLVFLGQFFDLFDGRMARKYGSTRNGPMYDDIADGTSFGLGIGYLIYSVLSEHSPEPVAILLASIYVLCIVFRLYRFLHPKVVLPHGVFQGMPAPAGAMLGGSSALLFGDRLPWLAWLLVLATTGLLISSIRYRHFGQRIWPGLPKFMKLLVFILFLFFVNIALTSRDHAYAFIMFCFTMGAIYTVYGLAIFGTKDEEGRMAESGEEDADATESGG